MSGLLVIIPVENWIFYFVFNIKIAWIGSGATGAQYFFCSFGSILTDLFGAREIGALGGFVSSLGLLLSAHVTDIKFYFLTYSLLFGIGQAFMLTATLAILPQYFNKRLSLANGIMNLVTAIVVVLLPISTSWTLKTFGLKDTFYYLTILNLFGPCSRLTSR